MGKQTKAAQKDQIDALEKLREILPKGATVYTITRRSAGATHVISPMRITGGGAPGTSRVWNVSGLASRALGRRLDTRDLGVVCRGGGMDMAFDLVYSLSYAMYGDGYALEREAI